MSVAAPDMKSIEVVVLIEAERIDSELDGVRTVELISTIEGGATHVAAPTFVEASRLLRVAVLRKVAALIEAGELP